MRRTTLPLLSSLCAATLWTRTAQSADPFMPPHFPTPTFAAKTFNVQDFGATGGGVANDTPAINKAIENGNADGSGTVTFPAGKYSAASIHLKSNVRLLLDADAAIFGGPPENFEKPEPNEFDKYQDFGRSHFHDSLMWGENIENFALVGGKINGGTIGHGDPNKKIGTIKNVKISNVTITDCLPGRQGPVFPSTISGRPESSLENITLENIKINCPGGETNRAGMNVVPPYPKDYSPRSLGPRPAAGFYIRPVKGLTFRNVEFTSDKFSTESLPRIFLLDAKYLQATRRHIRKGDTNYARALAELERDARPLLKIKPFSVVNKATTPPSGDKHDYMSEAPYFWPNPDTTNGLPYIRRDGDRNPDINKISDHANIGRMPDTAETLALAYYYTGNETYAAKATEILRVWFLEPATRMNPNLQYAQAILGVNSGRGIGLIESRGLARAVDAIGLLAGSKAWTEKDQRGLEKWFAELLQWMRESKNGKDEAAAKNNHGTYYDVQVASFALFLGQTEFATDILKTARTKRIAVQVEPDGRQPLELARTKAWSYSIGNLAGLMSLAKLGEAVGVDLWHYETPDGRSIRKAFDYLAPFGAGESHWPHRQLGGWTADGFQPLLRQMAGHFPEPEYLKMLRKLSRETSANRGALVHPVLDQSLPLAE